MLWNLSQLENEVLITKLSFKGTFSIKSILVDIIFLVGGDSITMLVFVFEILEKLQEY